MANKKAHKASKTQDIIEQGLISSKSLSAFLKATAKDKRTKRSTQREARELFKERGDKGVAKDLGISRQRATALKKQIEKGNAYSPELRDILRSTREEYISTPQRMDEGVMFFPSQERLSKSVKVEVIKPFGFLEDALEFWENIIGSDEYIAITKQGDFYNVVGLGTRSQRPHMKITKEKGRTKKTYQRGASKNRVTQILAKYKK